MPAKVCIIGNSFGKLKVIAEGPPHFCPSGKRHTTVICQCECGTVQTILKQSLLSGDRSSCGCYRRPPKGSDGRTFTKAWQTWKGMMSRCFNPRNKRYPHYGGRGIKVCQKWLDFAEFFKDMGERPPGMTIERRNNNGDYEPHNCRWATRFEQNQNTSRSRIYQLGNTRASLAVLCRKFGVNRDTVDYRLTQGWPLSAALSTPPHTKIII